MKLITTILALLSLSCHAQDSAYVQSKLNAGGVWHETRTFKLETAVVITVPIDMAGQRFIVMPHITGNSLGAIRAHWMSGITIRDVEIHSQLPAGAFCDGTNNAYHGVNIHLDHIDNLTIDGLSSSSVPCGSAAVIHATNATITRSVFANNGKPNTHNQWADGLTLLNCTGCTVQGNWFINNTDLGMVFGGGQNTLVTRNVFLQKVPAFAALGIDNFNGQQSGDFTGTTVTDNYIECGQWCDFGINVGPHAWYLSSNTIGGTVSFNRIVGGKIPLLVGGAGTVAAPVTIKRNFIQPYLSPGAAAEFSCGYRITHPYIVSPDSFVDNIGVPFVSQYHELCP